jgi:RNA polymerase-binding transcription factor DksA
VAALETAKSRIHALASFIRCGESLSELDTAKMRAELDEIDDALDKIKDGKV